MGQWGRGGQSGDGEVRQSGDSGQGGTEWGKEGKGTLRGGEGDRGETRGNRGEMHSDMHTATHCRVIRSTSSWPLFQRNWYALSQKEARERVSARVETQCGMVT